MYDTVNIFLPAVQPDVNLLGDVRRSIFNQGQSVVTTGSWENMRVHCNARGTTVAGSLPKLVHGTNITSIEPDKVNDALDMISDGLQLPIKNGEVRRIDIAATLEMEFPPSSYFRLLADVSRLKRVEYGGESVSFLSRTHSLIFYDKGKELLRRRNKTESLIESVSGSNLLRYEYQLKKPGTYYPNGLKASQLAEAGIHSQLVREWRTAYQSVLKESESRCPSLRSDSPRNMLLDLARFGLKELGGLNRVMHQTVDQSQKLSPMQKTRLRKTLRALTCSGEQFTTSDLLIELNQKVEETAREAIQS